ncbi:MAG: DUF3299 domain-containing protein [Pirellulales bacterium]
MYRRRPSGRLASAVFLPTVITFLAGCGAPPPRATTAATPAGGTPGQTAPERPRPPADDTAVRDISFDDIKLDLAKGAAFTPDALTARVRELERHRVRIRGYILPSFQQTGLTQFVLVRDNLECCFGPGAALHDCVVVRMAPGKSAEFSIRPVAVTGVFRVEELRGPGGGHLAIYALDGLEVK